MNKILLILSFLFVLHSQADIVNYQVSCSFGMGLVKKSKLEAKISLEEYSRNLKGFFNVKTKAVSDWSWENHKEVFLRGSLQNFEGMPHFIFVNIEQDSKLSVISIIEDNSKLYSGVQTKDNVFYPTECKLKEVSRKKNDGSIDLDFEI